MPFCTNCGAKLPEGSNVCSSCGTVATPLDPQPQYQEPPYRDPQYRNPDPSQDQSQHRNPYQNQYQNPYQNQYQYQEPYQDPYQDPNMNRMGGFRANIRKRELVLAIILCFVTCGIYGLVWLYGAGDKVDRIRQMNGESASNSGLIYLLLTLFGLGIVAYALIQAELNKVALDA